MTSISPSTTYRRVFLTKNSNSISPNFLVMVEVLKMSSLFRKIHPYILLTSNLEGLLIFLFSKNEKIQNITSLMTLTSSLSTSSPTTDISITNHLLSSKICVSIAISFNNFVHIFSPKSNWSRTLNKTKIKKMRTLIIFIQLSFKRKGNVIIIFNFL